jgi:hypothetical protein
MRKETVRIVVVVFILQVIVTAVIWMFGDSELVIFDDQEPAPGLTSLSQIEGGCIDAWTAELCAYAGIHQSELYYCACINGAEYCSCEYVLDNGCVSLTPTDELSSVQMCARDYRRTSTSIDVTTSAKPCGRVLIWDLCLTIWRQELTFSR